MVSGESCPPTPPNKDAIHPHRKQWGILSCFREYGEAHTSTGKSERAIPVMSPQDFMAMAKGELVCFSLEHKPIRLKSMYAKRHPQLMARFGWTLPERARKSPTAESQTEMPSAPKPPPLESWHYDLQLFRKWPQVLAERGGEGENVADMEAVN